MDMIVIDVKSSGEQINISTYIFEHNEFIDFFSLSCHKFITI